MSATIVFLHIPKTAGQTIHHELVRLVGGERYVSPVRVHTQAPAGAQMPPGYRLYSGHIDWDELGDLPEDRFAFTVLRDPRERIASFYFYLLKEAWELETSQLDKPENKGKKVALTQSADDYFFGGNKSWQRFILDHYDNFYTSYFASRRMTGRLDVGHLAGQERQAEAMAGLSHLQGVYFTDNLTRLERDIEARFAASISVCGTYLNTGGHDPNEARWPKLLARFESDESAARLEAFVQEDEALMRRLSDQELRCSPGVCGP